MAASAILDFKNFEILTTGTVKRVSHRENFVEIVQTVAKMAIFRFFKMAAASISDF